MSDRFANSPVAGSLAVLHVALEPTSGVWSVMRDVSQAQADSGRYRAVAMGVIASSAWPSRYAAELEKLSLPHYRSKTIQTFGTAQFLWQRFEHPPIGAWVEHLMKSSVAESIVIHFHNAWLSGVFLPIKDVDSEKVKVVVTFHGVCTTLERMPIRRWLHRQMAQRLLRYGAKLTSVDVGNLPLAQSIFGIPGNDFTIVANGVKADPDLSAALWSGEGDFVIGYVGLLAEHKGWRMIVDAVLKMREGGRKVCVLIAGAGPEEEIARTISLEHPEAIEFVGHVSDPRKNIMPRLHLLSLMSTYEGLPMVLIEAASVGLPVVATATGGVREILEDGVTGIVVSRSVDDLVRAIDLLYNDPERMFRMGHAARTAHAKHFELSEIACLYHGVYLQ